MCGNRCFKASWASKHGQNSTVVFVSALSTVETTSSGSLRPVTFCEHAARKNISGTVHLTVSVETECSRKRSFLRCERRSGNTTGLAKRHNRCWSEHDLARFFSIWSKHPLAFSDPQGHCSQVPSTKSSPRRSARPFPTHNHTLPLVCFMFSYCQYAFYLPVTSNAPTRLAMYFRVSRG